GEEGGLDQVAIDGGVREPDEEEGDDAADDTLEEAVDQEGAAHEAVGGTDEAHDRDLAFACENGHPDGGTDDDHGHGRECDAEDDAGGTGDVADVVELLHPVLAVANVIHEAVALESLSHRAHGSWIAEAGLETHFQRGGEEVGVED